MIHSQGALPGAFSFSHNAGNDYMKYAIATFVLTVLCLFFLECGQQTSASLLTRIGASELLASFVTLMTTALTS